MTPPDLESSIQMLLDGELSAEEFRALEAELLENPEALDTYRNWVGLHCGLQHHGSLNAAVAKLPVVPIERVLALQRQRTVRISLLAAAAVLLVSAVALWINQSPFTPRTLAGFRTAPGSSFTLTHSGNGKRPTDGMLAEGSRIVLDHGVVELDLPHDVRAIIEAPATLTIIDDRTVDLDRGRAFFEVQSPDGHGFTVITPNQKIVDLGTAFGIDVPVGSDQTHLHVFTGSVRIEGLEGKETGEVIHAPRAVAIRDIRVEKQLDETADRFRRRLPDKLNQILVEDFESGLIAGREFDVWMDRTAIRDLDGNRFAGIPEKKPLRFQTSLAPAVNIPVKSYAYDGPSPPMDRPSDHQPTGQTQGLFLDPDNTKLTDGLPGDPAGWQSGTYAGFKDDSYQADTRITFDLGATQTVDRILVSSHATTGESPKSFRLSTSRDGETFTLPVVVNHESTGSPKIETTLDVSDWAPARFWRLEIVNPTAWLFLGEVTFTKTGSAAALLIKDPVVPPGAKEGESPPQLLHLKPGSGEDAILSQGHLAMIFDEPVEFGSGRIVFQDLTEERRAEIVVGSQPATIKGSEVRIAPPLNVSDGSQATGYPAGWMSDLPVTFLNPSGTGNAYQSDQLEDHGQTRGEIGAMRGPTLVSLSGRHHAHPLQREIGTIAADHRYTVSLGVGTRREKSGSRFLGYKVRLISRGILLAELADDRPPGPANTITAVGFSWNSSSLPEGVSTGDPLTLEISSLKPTVRGPGYLDLDHLRVSAVEQ
jgi:ferric-dicitrate binding protein FerR (iron transport regulator)